MSGAAEPRALAAPAAAVGRSVSGDLADAGRAILAGVAAGAIAGFVVGGIGGRLAMFLLRLTSSDLAVGLQSDDGFTIGQFDLGDTLSLALATAFFGAANGAVYALLRGAIPVSARIPAWTVFTGLGFSSQIVHADGVDFTLLGPRAFAIGLFVALPLLCGLTVASLVERLEPTRWSPARTAAVAGISLVGTIGLAVAIGLTALVLVARRAGWSAGIARGARVLVPAALVVLSLAFAVQLGRTIAELA